MGHQSLARHTEAVLNGLRNGKRLYEALNDANDAWQPQKYPHAGTELDMTFRGDGWSRLVNVYVSEVEGATLFGELKNSWYWFKP